MPRGVPSRPPAPIRTRVNAGKRLNLNLSEPVYQDLLSLARMRRNSMTEIVRLALGLVKIIIHEASLGHKVIITTDDGRPVKEVVIPN